MTSRTAPLGGKTPSERSRPIRVLVADDHPLLRDGIAALISAEPDITLAATCSSARIQSACSSRTITRCCATVSPR